MYQDKKFCSLGFEFGRLDVFKRMLNIYHKRIYLLKCFQALIEHESNAPNDLINNYISYKTMPNIDDSIIDLGLKLGGFFSEGGWYPQAIEILDAVESILNKNEKNSKYLCKLLDCLYK